MNTSLDSGMGIYFTRVGHEIAHKAMLILVIAVMSTSVLAKPQNQPTEIRVQIMDSRTHRPLKGRKVQITFSGTDRQFYNNAPRMIGRTGSDGVVVFKVGQPVPPFMGVFVWWAYPCANPETFSARSVLDDGVIAQWSHTGIKKADEWCTADPHAPQLQRQSGTVIFFVHPMNRFVWSWYDLWA
jgi:hypothetical protein